MIHQHIAEGISSSSCQAELVEQPDGQEITLTHGQTITEFDCNDVAQLDSVDEKHTLHTSHSVDLVQSPLRPRSWRFSSTHAPHTRMLCVYTGKNPLFPVPFFSWWPWTVLSCCPAQAGSRSTKTRNHFRKKKSKRQIRERHLAIGSTLPRAGT